MSFECTHPWWIWVLPVILAWVLYYGIRSDVQTSPWRRRLSLLIRLLVVSAVVLALSGLRWLSPRDGLNVFWMLDRSDSIPASQQEAALNYIKRTLPAKKSGDQAGLIVFGADAAIESTPSPIFDVQKKIFAVIGSERTDIASAIRLGTAAFPDSGQKRLVILSDGNENLGNALESVSAAKSLGVTVDVVPMGITRKGDVSIQNIMLPNQLKKDQPFELKIHAKSDRDTTGTIRLYRNQEYLGEQKVELNTGKNLFVLPQNLPGQGFFSYEAYIDVPDDTNPKNNRASNFTFVRGDSKVLVISSAPSEDAPLVAALRSSGMEVKSGGLDLFPGRLDELQSYDALFLCNIAAGDLGRDNMQAIENAVRDFGVGLVCIGGDQTYAAGGYRGTPLETTLPVDMELDSKKVLPSGALVIVCHATEFPGGNQWARDIAFAALDALGPSDEMGIVLWDGSNRWLFPLGKVGDKKKMGQAITGMIPGDMPDFAPVMTRAFEGLKKSTANLKHMVVFSDGDPGAPSQELVDEIIKNKITISSVMIGGHVAPQTMVWLSDQGRGRFYDVNSPSQLPQIFIKEAAVILKSAIFEEPFTPKIAGSSEFLRGFAADEYPVLKGYVATTAKPRAEVPLVTDKGDPLLAHWQYGLGRAIAFTSDAKSKWASSWIQWPKYRQFWTQAAQWVVRRLDSANYVTEVSMDQGEGVLNVEALDPQGNYRNFLNLEAIVSSPKGERKTVRLEQTGPGRYEAHFPTREIGAYLINLLEKEGGKIRGSQVLGTSINYSPEYEDVEPNLGLLRRLAEQTGGKVLAPNDLTLNPFTHDRIRTHQPFDLWEWLLKLAILLFPLDVAVRRIQIDREEWVAATRTLRRWLFFWKPVKPAVQSDESLTTLLARREKLRATLTSPSAQPVPDLFTPNKPNPVESVVLPNQSIPSTPAVSAAPKATEPSKEASAGTQTTTSRLLDAKRRAQQKRKN